MTDHDMTHFSGRCPTCGSKCNECESAAMRQVLGSLQELLAKQIAVPDGNDRLLCAACGREDNRHEESCPVSRGLAIIERAFSVPSTGASE